MSLNTTIELKKDYVEVRIEGPFDFQSAISVNDAILGSIEKYQATKIFVDFRKVTGDLAPMERFHYAENFAKKYLELLRAGRIKRSQLVFLGNYPQLDPGRFEETVAVNRGVPVRSTEDPKEVWEWLGIGPEDEKENK
jgi:hypothetical protein